MTHANKEQKAKANQKNHYMITRHATDVENPQNMENGSEVTFYTWEEKRHYSKVCESAKAVHVVGANHVCNDIPLFLGTADADTDPEYADFSITDHQGLAHPHRYKFHSSHTFLSEHRHICCLSHNATVYQSTLTEV